MERIGYLEIILGPMYSGKTSALLEEYRKCKFCSIPVVAINHSLDIRYDEENISTHNKDIFPCIKIEKLSTLIDRPELKDAHTVLINECQFFPDLYDFVLHLLAMNKKIYICGLDGDFERKKFGQILDLIPHADMVQKLTALCAYCKDGTKGIFSMRVTNEKEQMLVGSDIYKPVCRRCYDTYNKH